MGGGKATRGRCAAPRPVTHSLPPARQRPARPQLGAARAAREPSAKRGVRTSGRLCAEPGRPPCAPLRCLLPPFCCGDPHPLPPDEEGDRLPLDRWLPVFRRSSLCLGLSLGPGDMRGAGVGRPLCKRAPPRGKSSSPPALSLGQEASHLESKAPALTQPRFPFKTWATFGQGPQLFLVWFQVGISTALVNYPPINCCSISRAPQPLGGI